MLLGLGQTEVDSIVQEQGHVEITCEFCDSTYTYDPVDAAALFKGVPSDGRAGDDSDAANVDRNQLH